MKPKKPMSASARVMQAGRGLSVSQFSRMANDMHGGISYTGCSKGSIVKALLNGELGQKPYTANEVIAEIKRVKDESNAAQVEQATLTRARRRRCDYEDLPRHESHGLIGISRVQGIANLHGSPIKSHGFIELHIHEGHRKAGLGGEHYHDGKIIACVRLSETQFAQMITTPNMGCGVPCTLTHYRDGDRLKQCEDPPAEESVSSITRRQFKEDVQDSMATMKATRRRIEKKLSEGKLSKKLQDELRSEIFELLRIFEDSAPFVMERFEENVQATVATAKTELASYVSLVAQKRGLEALREDTEFQLLIEEDDG